VKPQYLVDAADRTALAPKRRGPKPDASARQIEHLNRDIAGLRRKRCFARILPRAA
jgi:hypothetical protein